MRQGKKKLGGFTGRKYNIDPTIFTKENALSYYLLGVYMTDGCIVKKKNKNSYTITLTSVDVSWLRNIRNIICKEKPIKQSKYNRKLYIFSIHHQDIAEWLISKGCTPKKSFTLKFPKVPQSSQKIFGGFYKRMYGWRRHYRFIQSKEL